MVRGLLLDSLAAVNCLLSAVKAHQEKPQNDCISAHSHGSTIDLTGLHDAIRWISPNCAIYQSCQISGSGTICATDNPARPTGVHLEASLTPPCNASSEVLR